MYVSVFPVRLELWSPVCYLDLDDLESTDNNNGNSKNGNGIELVEG